MLKEKNNIKKWLGCELSQAEAVLFTQFLELNNIKYLHHYTSRRFDLLHFDVFISDSEAEKIGSWMDENF